MSALRFLLTTILALAPFLAFAQKVPVADMEWEQADEGVWTRSIGEEEERVMYQIERRGKAGPVHFQVTLSCPNPLRHHSETYRWKYGDRYVSAQKPSCDGRSSKIETAGWEKGFVPFPKELSKLSYPRYPL